MKLKSIIAAFALLLFVVPAYAHSTFTITPKDGEVLTAPLELIELNFGKQIKLIKLSLKDAEEKKVEIKKPESGFNKAYQVSFSELASGNYNIKWRGIGEDGHVVKGVSSFSFEKE